MAREWDVVRQTLLGNHPVSFILNHNSKAQCIKYVEHHSYYRLEIGLYSPHLTWDKILQIKLLVIYDIEFKREYIDRFCCC